MTNSMSLSRYICMEQELSNIGIIGGGPAGSACAYFINQMNPDLKVSVIDTNPMRTILPTGGGRCNLGFAEFNFKDLAKNYPRGEKFLYSVFSKFSTADTVDLFSELGIETYIQEDMRIFPTSNSSQEVRDKFLKNLYAKNRVIKENALRIERLDNGFRVITDMGSYDFDKLVVATGGHSGYDMIKRLGVEIVPLVPSLVGLVTKENFASIKGVALKDVYNKETGMTGDMLFTHFGVSGPLIYKISSVFARKDMPYSLTFDLCQGLEDLQGIMNDNPHKYIKNLLSEYLPHSLVEFILNQTSINADTKAHMINGKMRDGILDKIHNFTVSVKSTKKDGETVTAGGVDLNKVNSKTMEYRDIPNLYFIGEILDIDGFCGGFNLQNCWSTAYVCAKGITAD